MSNDGNISTPSGKDHEAPEGDHKVGPGHPPKEHRFKKGAPSPNPKGRPRKTGGASPDLKKELESGLAEKVKVKKGDKFVWVTKGALGMQQLINQYAKGDRHARRDLVEMASKLGVNLLANIEQGFEELAPDHQQILTSFFEQRKRDEEPGSSMWLPRADGKQYAPPDLTE